MNDSVKILLEVIDNASPQLQQFQKNLTTTAQSITSFAKTAAVIGGSLAVAAAGGLAMMAKNAINVADEMNDAAERLGITAEALSALGYAAGMSGTNVETMQTGLQQLNKSIVEAQDPASAAANAFKYLGISVKEADGSLKSADKVFGEMADKFTKMPEGPSKTAVAMELLGKGGAALIPVLNAGKTGLEEFRAEAERLGLIISTETAKAAGEFNDTIDRVGNAVTGVGMSIAKEVLPTLNALAAEMINNVKEGEGFKNFAKGVGEVFKWVVKAGAGVVLVFQTIGKGIGALAAAASRIIAGDFAGASQIISDFKDEAKAGAISTAEFMEKIDAGIAPMEKSTTATKAGAGALGEYANKSKAAKDAKDEEAKAFEKAYAALLKESEGYKQMTAVQQVEYNIAKQVAGFRDADHQKRMLQLAQQVDARRQAIALSNGEAQQLQQQITTTEDLTIARKEADQYQQEMIKYGSRVADILATQRSRTRELESSVKALSIELRSLQETDPEGNKKRIEDITAEIDGRLAILNASEETNTQNLRNSISTARIAEQTKWLKELVIDTKDALADVELQYLFIKSALDAGLISQEQFNSAVAKLDTKKFGLMRSQLTELQVKTADFAGQIQQTMGGAFYDIMQGNFKDIGTSFKQMLDKMVAEALAANLARALFGDFGRTGSVSGTGGGMLTSLVGSLFGTQFRESGGPVSAGQPYIVGEKRPELFIPNRSGTILPDTSALAMAGGNSVQLSITAMDSQDVIRALDKIKRPLADMVNSTGRAYNMK